MNVYHQCGHNLVWNLDSLTQDRAGDGMIFSPVNDGPDRIMVLERDIRTRSLFDPQFYVPASERGKLPEFPFFLSAVMPALTTTDFRDGLPGNSAAVC